MKLNKNIELNKIYKKCPVHMKSVSDKYDALLQDFYECEENDYCKRAGFVKNSAMTVRLYFSNLALFPSMDALILTAF